MTTAELLPTARARAGLSQAALAGRLRLPRSQLARWEGAGNEPGLATVRRVLQACGFDLSLALVPYEPDEERVAELGELQRQTPQERLRGASSRPAASPTC